MFFCFCLSPCEFDLHVWAIPILYFIYWNHGLLHRFFGHTQRSLDEADVHCGNWKLLDQIAARLFDYHRCDGPCDRACKMLRSVPNHWPCRESENHVIIISNPHFETLHFWLLELDLAGQCNIFARCFRMQNCSFSSLPLGTQIAVKDLMFYVLCFHVFSLRFIKMRCSIMLFIHFLAVLYQWFCNTDAGGAKDPFSMGSMSELRNHQPKEIEVVFLQRRTLVILSKTGVLLTFNCQWFLVLSLLKGPRKWRPITYFLDRDNPNHRIASYQNQNPSFPCIKTYQKLCPVLLFPLSRTNSYRLCGTHLPSLSPWRRQEVPAAALGEPMLWRTMEKMLLVVDDESRWG